MRHNQPPNLSLGANDGWTEPSQTDWRCANAAQIAAGLQDIRARTLAVFDAYQVASALQVHYSDELNPPLWELGHLGWFQELWIGRNPQRDAGIRYDHALARGPSLLAPSDSWYDSSTVAHAARWHLPLLAPEACKAYLAATLAQTLALLAAADGSDDALYFYRLALFHEAMHLEAAVYMAQALGVAVPACSFTTVTTDLIAARAIKYWANGQLSIQNQSWSLGSHGTGFAFDNELGAHNVPLADYCIDAHPVTWGQYLGYVRKTACPPPRYLRQAGEGFEQQVFGRWRKVDLNQAAVHISHPEALAYCQHAGRRLPTEAEWECAAMTQPDFAWGEVWEWTASTFNPYPGFVAHPYRDYSEPWFGTRPVLRGACTATQTMMRSAKYRNYFMPQRTDIFAGFRTCAL
jgi:gamma-glutamyl hercynylcysteine S-oxide synthase